MDRRLSILHLEDNPFDAELIRRELRRAGMECDYARIDTESELRAALAATSSDIILADYNLPGFDGMMALSIVRETAPDIPFIVVSGAIGEERAVATLRQGATDYVSKDRLSHLGTAIARAIAERDERRRHNTTQEALRVSQERFLLASHATRDVIWDWAVGSDTFWANEALVTAWGYDGDPSRVPFDWWLSHIHPAEAEHVRRHFEATTESTDATHWHIRYRFRRADGRYGHVEDRGMFVRDGSRRAVRLIGAMQDITARLEAERELEQEQRISSLGRVAAIIAHEFNNVLMGIQPFVEILKKKNGADETVCRAARHIGAAVGRGRQITRDILRAANPGEPNFETVDLAGWLRDAAAEVSGLFVDGLSMTVDVPAFPIPVRLDPHQMHQVITNLAINARDAMAGRGDLRIAMATCDSEVTITVADTGTGIPDDILPQIFDPLFTTKHTGTGLGLAVSKQIVTKNGGRIAVDSVRGKGTVFTLTFPVASNAQSANDRVDVVAAPELRVRRLLLVDDDAMVVEGMKALLEMEGFEVRCVYRASEVERAVTEFLPDVVILDLTLPDGNGVDVYRRLVASHADVRVVFASGDAEAPNLAEWKARGHVAFVSKPYDFATLVERMREVAA
ncbi:MAG TPA: response regulator [Thermoanaerobaculia bacterium]|nr:response regulator [Thermoanaerobaculia bacterium]